MKKLIAACVAGVSILAFPSNIFAETVGIFFDQAVEQIKFAAGDVKAALEKNKFTVEVLPLSSLNPSYPNKKVVIALANNVEIKKLLEAQGGKFPAGLGEQSYELLTTTNGKTSHWVIGGDASGAMYGGLQIAEDIQFDGFEKPHHQRVAPTIMRRGAKLNMAFDRRLPTYSGGTKFHTSAAMSVKQTWDYSFWERWIDEQARNRYNVLTVWNHNPFPALVTVPGFEDSTLPYIEGSPQSTDGFKEDKSLTIENRILFWKKVMKHAKDRGFDFYFFNWNIVPEHINTFDKYKDGMTRGDLTDDLTKNYLNSAIKKLLETYPNLAGFGVSPGDSMEDADPSPSKKRKPTAKEVAQWVYDAYSKGVTEYARENRDRKFTFIHRLLKVKYDDVHENWKQIVAEFPNLHFDVSMKYCMAFTYSTTTPEWAKFDVRDLKAKGGSTWLTLRNDGFFYSDFGDPQFVREFLANLPPSEHSGGEHDGKPCLRGIYLGHDAYTPTVSYLYKNEELNRDPVTGKPMLEIQRKWYMEMLWGRLAYDKNTPDEAFQRGMAQRYPSLPSQTLFEAWALASRPHPKIVEQVQGLWSLDSHFYAEFCMWRNDGVNYFRAIEHFINGSPDPEEQRRTKGRGTFPPRGSWEKLASIKETGQGEVKGRISSFEHADEIQALATKSLQATANMSSGGDIRAEALLNNLKQQAYLAMYYAHKIRGATFLAAATKDKARDEMFHAYGWWMLYVNSMDAMYKPERFRTYDLADMKKGWFEWNEAVLKDYTELGGKGLPPPPKLP
jgi:hypothetical protein